MSIGRNAAMGMATNLVVFALGIVLSVVLTRNFTPESRGAYAVLVTTNSLLANLCNLSLGVACSTFLARGEYPLRQVNVAAVFLALTLGLLAMAAVSALFPLLETSVFRGVPYSYLAIALVLTPMTIYQIYWNAMMTGLNRIALLSRVNLALNLGNALVMILLVGVLRLGLTGFLWGWVISGTAGVIAAFVMTLRLDGFAWPLWKDVRRLLHFGLRTHGVGIAHHLFLRFDVLALNPLAGTTAVGFYQLATSLAEKLWIPINVVTDSSVGKIAGLPRAASAQLTARVARSAVLMLLSIAVPFAAVSPWLIPFLYGDAYAPAVAPLIILLSGTPAFAVMMIINNYIFGQMQRPGLLAIVSWLQLGVSIPLYFGMILWLGMVGAALASALTYWLAMACTVAIFVHDSGIPTSQALIPQRSDFGEYARLARGVMRRIPLAGPSARGRS
jgi:O-antigen/teichoic acid export membrane protein